MTSRQSRPHVVILGGGFGGLKAAQELRNAPVDITLVDRRNHHLFQPLLYQVATGGLSPADIAEPIRNILRSQDNVRVILDEAIAIDLPQRQVILSQQTLAYDYLILAVGVTNNYFGNEDDWEPHAPGLKSVEEALEIRKRFLLAFEHAELCEDPDERRRLLTSVIIGAGPTGVELAGTMAEMSHKSLPHTYHSIGKDEAKVILIEGGPRVLASFSEPLSESAKQQLEDLQVEVILNQRVTAIEDGAVFLGDRKIPCGNIFWAAGIRAESITQTLGVELDRGGRVMVRPNCSIPGFPEAFAIGDCAHLIDGSGRRVPGVAQGAIQSGAYAARVIRETYVNPVHKKLPPFGYFDKGNLATIGRAAAIAEIGNIKLSGLPAWFIWLFVHLVFIVGFDNQLIVFIQWAWQYIAFQRGAQLITATKPPQRTQAPPQPNP